jgi:hypothetical protein
LKIGQRCTFRKRGTPDNDFLVIVTASGSPDKATTLKVLEPEDLAGFQMYHLPGDLGKNFQLIPVTEGRTL